MKQVLSEDWVAIPDGVTVTIKGREVTVKGKKGEIKKNFSHMPVEM